MFHLPRITMKSIVGSSSFMIVRLLNKFAYRSSIYIFCKCFGLNFNAKKAVLILLEMR